MFCSLHSSADIHLTFTFVDPGGLPFTRAPFVMRLKEQKKMTVRFGDRKRLVKPNFLNKAQVFCWSQNPDLHSNKNELWGALSKSMHVQCLQMSKSTRIHTKPQRHTPHIFQNRISKKCHTVRDGFWASGLFFFLLSSMSRSCSRSCFSYISCCLCWSCYSCYCCCCSCRDCCYCPSYCSCCSCLSCRFCCLCCSWCC